jgi:hypothetical protein
MKRGERMANYSVSKLRRRIVELESEIQELKGTVRQIEKSPEYAVELLRGIVLSDSWTNEGDRLFQRSMNSAIEYLKLSPQKPKGEK